VAARSGCRCRREGTHGRTQPSITCMYTQVIGHVDAITPARVNRGLAKASPELTFRETKTTVVEPSTVQITAAQVQQHALTRHSIAATATPRPGPNRGFSAVHQRISYSRVLGATPLIAYLRGNKIIATSSRSLSVCRGCGSFGSGARRAGWHHPGSRRRHRSERRRCVAYPCTADGSGR